MIKGRLESGFEFELEDDVMDDYDLVLLFGQYRKKPSMDIIADIAVKMLGEENRLSSPTWWQTTMTNWSAIWLKRMGYSTSRGCRCGYWLPSLSV